MSRIPRRAGAAALLATTALLATACGGSSGSTSSAPPPDSNQPTTITFMEAMSSGTQKSSLATIVKDFQAAHPTITVDLQEQPDYGTLQTKINAQTAAGTPPTIAQVYPDWADDLASSQVIVPLDGYAAQSADYRNFPAGIQADLKLTDGKTWLWPFNKSVVVQYYNTALVPQAPTTWDQFAAAAKKASTGTVVGLSIDPGTSSSPAGGTALFEILAQAYGDPVFAADGTPQFTRPGVVKALDYLVAMKKAGSLALGTNYPGQVALGGQTGAFDVSSAASYPYDLKAVGDKFPLGVAALPAGPSGAANQLAGTDIALFSAATDPEKAAAWTFMQYLTSAPEMAFWASTTGYLPVNKAATTEPAFAAYAAKNPWVTAATAQLDTASSLPPKAFVGQASGALALALQDAVTNGTPSAAALQKAQDSALKAQKDGQ